MRGAIMQEEQTIQPINERIDVLKTLYDYLEKRYQEQVELLKNIDTMITNRLKILGAILGLLTFLVSQTWRLSGGQHQTVVTMSLLVAMLPVFIAFFYVFYLAHKVSGRHICQPRVKVPEMLELLQYETLYLDPIYQDFVANLTLTVKNNEDIIKSRQQLEDNFRLWNIRAVYATGIPVVIMILVACLFMIL